MNSKRKKIKNILGYIYLIVTMGILIYIGVSSHELGNFGRTITKLKKGYVLAAFLAYIAFVFFEGYIAYYCLKKHNKDVKLLSSIKTTLVGMYYGCITPSSSGSQPAQIYYFNRQGVSIAESTSMLSIRFFCYQLTTVSTSLTSFIVFSKHVREHASHVIPFIIFGLCVNLIPIILLLLIAVNRKIFNKIFIFIVKVLHKIRVIKNRDKSIEKINITIDEYYNKISFVLSNPKMLLYVLLMSIVEVFSLMIIVYFVYCAFGLHKYSIFLIVGLQLMLYTSVAFAPLPGASGAQEVGFFVYFRDVFPHHMMYMAILIWRFFTYYLTVILGAVLVLIDSLTTIIKEKKGNNN